MILIHNLATSFQPGVLFHLQKAFEQAKITLTAEQNGAFLRYADILCEWNRKFNLTAITSFEEIVQKHFVDCAAPLFVEMIPLSGKLIDVGSGAGFPGIPLKILCPDLRIVLLDSLQKRVNFLNYAVDELKLDGVRAVHGRAEDLARNDDFREQFDVATARAVVFWLIKARRPRRNCFWLKGLFLCWG